MVVGRLGTCLSMGAGRARMEHEKNGVGNWGESGEEEEEEEMVVDRRTWLLEVDGGQLAAGGLRELCQHAGQGPVLSLQPLFNLPQGLNLLYLGEVLQEGENNNHNTGKQREESGSDRVTEEEGMRFKRRGLMKDRTIKLIEKRGRRKRRKKGKQKRKTVRKWGQILETEGMIKSFFSPASAWCLKIEWKSDTDKISQLAAT